MSDKKLSIEQPRRIRELESQLATQREIFIRYVHDNGPTLWDDADELVTRLLSKEEA